MLVSVKETEKLSDRWPHCEGRQLCSPTQLSTPLLGLAFLPRLLGDTPHLSCSGILVEAVYYAPSPTLGHR